MLKLSEIMNKFHLFLSGYIVVGWMFSDIHSKILLGLIPSVYVNWLVNDHKCILTVLEHKLNEKEDQEEVYEGFVLKKLKSYNIEVSNDDLNRALTLIAYHSFLQSYRNVILT
jgi:hypothetical protein